MAVTRVTITPRSSGPDDFVSISAQSGLSKKRKFSGSGSDTNIITSSARAYVSALNTLLSWNARTKEKNEDLDTIEDGVGDAVPMEQLPVTQV